MTSAPNLRYEVCTPVHLPTPELVGEIKDVCRLVSNLSPVYNYAAEGVNRIIQQRIRVSLMAYSYELEDKPLWSDQEFDELCASLDTHTPTGNQEMDDFFKEEFEKFTGSWVYAHPQLDRLKEICTALRKWG